MSSDNLHNWQRMKIHFPNLICFWLTFYFKRTSLLSTYIYVFKLYPYLIYLKIFKEDLLFAVYWAKPKDKGWAPESQKKKAPESQRKSLIQSDLDVRVSKYLQSNGA
jgi:hypothetical protein